MNLFCDQLDLWQTPTYITFMCYSNEDGGWNGIRYRYIEWVRSHLNGVWDNDTLYNDMKEKVDKHIEELMSFEKLDFYWA